MTRLASTLWASAASALLLAGTAAAQPTPGTPDMPEQTTPPDSTMTPAPTTTDTNPTSTTPSDATNTQGTTPSTTSTPAPTTTTGTTLQGNVDANVTTPHVNVVTPPPAYSRSTDFTAAPAPVYVEDQHANMLPSGLGIALAAGGGASGFTNDTLRNTTDVGGDWDVRATLGTRSLISLEGSYIGSAQQINALGLDSGAVLVGNGVQGDVRLNGTFDLPIQPFIYAGAAWRHYGLSNTNENLSDVASSDDVLEIPMGLGIAAHLSGMILDVRGEFRASTMEDLIPSATTSDTVDISNINDSAAMNRWGAKATIGVEF